MTDLTPRLDRLGDQLERAARRDLRPPRRRPRRRIAIAAVAALVVVPGAAAAGIELISEEEVARSLPAGTLWLQGTEPTCTVVRQDVEYRCTLGKPPADAMAEQKLTGPTCEKVRTPDGPALRCTPERRAVPPIENWTGTVMPSVDASKHVNGGCRSQNAAGTEWTCYIGEEAVRQEIIGPDFLGEYAPTPGVG